MNAFAYIPRAGFGLCFGLPWRLCAAAQAAGSCGLRPQMAGVIGTSQGPAIWLRPLSDGFVAHQSAYDQSGRQRRI
jgi:hypothetical protein